MTALWWPWLLVAAAVVWNLVSLRAELIAVPYQNDSSMHEQMVRVATAQLRAGHLPLTSWFAFLGEGSSQFLHYQSLPAILAGAVGLVTGPDVAFRWSLYLLLSLWPVSVYLSARLFGGGPAAAAGAAVMAPFLVSVTGVGYEQHAYLWVGYGVWTQLWASVTLPLAWGCAWQAIRHGRHRFWAVLLIALTCACHYETGYLALAPLILWPLVAGRRRWVRAGRALILAAGSLLAVAWVFVPLLAQRDWAATNEILHGTALENGYGAHQVLDWLLFGGLLDHGRLPVITALFWVGSVLAGMRWRRDRAGRALLAALLVCLLLSFGRATFGELVAVIPGSADLFFRRFMMGVQLAALLLAGRGAAGVASAVRLAPELWHAGRGSPSARTGRDHHRAPLALVAAVVVLFPAWQQLGRYDARDAAAITDQRRADDIQGARLDRLIAVIRHDGGGRTYAGTPSNWGASFTVGDVPVFKYLESRDVDEVGYTLRTASLMTDPEYDFDQSELGDYQLFGIRYLILPAGRRPPVPAALTRRVGEYSLWTVSGAAGVLHAGSIVGQLAANRSNIATRTLSLLRSDLARHGHYALVRFDAAGSGAPVRSPRASAAAAPLRLPGRVTAQTDRLVVGRAAGTVVMHPSGVVVLSASFDPGWSATVDGHARRTLMVAPALVATIVPAGTHHVVFEYHGYRDYALLFAISAATLLAAFCAYVVRPPRAVWRWSSRPHRHTGG